MFAPKIEQNETVDSYMDLIYSSLIQDNILESAEDDDSSSTKSVQLYIFLWINYGNTKRNVFNCNNFRPSNEKFLFANSFDRVQQRTQAESLLRNLYTQLKQDSAIGKNVEEHAANLNNINTEGIFAKIWGNNQIQEDEVTSPPFHLLTYPVSSSLVLVYLVDLCCVSNKFWEI
ncbi:25895_t:CDS:2 [Gigaspora margarita]|uniref:25895_t:CDS:1 n=1 Tax=Gigaspora margarita TaxID=4874 RepID=A0ABM8VZX2_GIGMA|nr:25895_t:CDS:2 [Gigaspora margarita]